MARGRRRAGRGESSAPVSAALGPARRASRAAQRTRRRRQRRTRTSVVAAVAVVVAVLAGGVFVGRAVTHHKTTPPKVRTQRTLLFEVTGTNTNGIAAALLAYDPAPRRASLVLVPPHTLADVAGIGNVVLGTAVRLGGPGVAREAVSDLMGVVVDQDWTLTSEAFAALVDRVGGVVVDVDVDVLATAPKGGTRILARAGAAQRLDGPTAVAYATYRQKGQDDITFQPRLQAVFEALLAALPDNAADVASSLSSLGPGSRLSWTPPELAAYLEGIRTAHAEDRYDPQVLPVAPIDTGGGATAFSIKVEDVATLVRTQLADSLPPNRAAGDNRVLILNGVGTPGLGAGIARRLRGEFQVVGTRNKQPFGVKESVVVVFDSSDPSLAKARRVATLLGLPQTAVRIGTQTQSVADVIVVVGADYKP
jgi:LCP family protein required for cell wall assembly